MKNHIRFLMLLFSMVMLNYISVSAQTAAEWKLPQIEIPLMQSDQVIAILKPKYFSKSAILTYLNENYQLKLKGRQCTITHLPSARIVAVVKRMNGKEVIIEFSDGPTTSLNRVGKKDHRQYLLAGSSSLKFEDDSISAEFEKFDLYQILIQGALVFSYTYKQYDKERGATVYYYPVYVPN